MITIEIVTMKLSGDREEYYVRVKRDDRHMDTSRYTQDFYNRALYERDMFRHVLLNEPKPNLLDEKYADKPKEKTSDQTNVD